MKKLYPSIFLCLILSLANGATIKYITQSGAGLKDGSSWANAGDSSQVQSFITNASLNNQIWIAAGTYKPNTYPAGCTGCSSNRKYAFLLKGGVSVYGGFNGTETLLSEAAPALNTTVLSGEIGSLTDSSDNIQHIVLALNLSSSTTLSGFTISRANANGGSMTVNGVTINNDGGGIFSYNSYLNIGNCILERNMATEYGSAVYIAGRSVALSECTIQYNMTANAGAIYTATGSHYIYQCLLKNNRHAGATGSCWGAGLLLNSTTQISFSVFEGNDAGDYGSSGGGGYGGAVNLNSGNSTFNRCAFANNKAYWGGAIEAYSANSSAYGTFNNCVFYHNTSSEGGAVFCNYQGFVSSNACTFYGNTASVQGSLSVENSGGTNSFTNCIAYSNSGPTFSAGGTFSYCLLQTYRAGTGNVYGNPLFTRTSDVDGPDNIWMTSDDGLGITCASPALDAASPTDVNTTDILGVTRPQGLWRDLGAYEKIPPVPIPVIDSIFQNPPSVCVGDSATFTVSPLNTGSDFTYQWTINGDVASGDTFSLKAQVYNNDVIRYLLTSANYCIPYNATENFSIAVAIAIVTPAISITASPAVVCDSTETITFRANASFGGNSAAFQWFRNSQPVGGNNDTFVPISYSNHDTISCLLTSSLACVTSSMASSNKIIINIPEPVTPDISISTNTPYCTGSLATFNSSITSGGSVPSYQWKKNGIDISSASTFSTSSINTGNEFYCILTSNESCVTKTNDTSNTLTMTVTPTVTPSVTISANTQWICSSPGAQTLILTATPTNGGNSPSYSWMKNGSYVGSSNPFQANNNSLLLYDFFEVKMTSHATCPNPDTAISNGITIYTYLAPAPPIITRSGNILTCSTSESYQWYFNNVLKAGATAQTYTATLTGTYKVVVTDLSGCKTSQSSFVTIATTDIPEIGEEQIRIYPNPATDQLFVESNDIALSEINIYNTTGNLVSQTKSRQIISIEISQFAKGVYVVEIKNKEASVKRRLVKM